MINVNLVNSIVMRFYHERRPQGPQAGVQVMLCAANHTLITLSLASSVNDSTKSVECESAFPVMQTPRVRH